MMGAVAIWKGHNTSIKICHPEVEIHLHIDVRQSEHVVQGVPVGGAVTGL